MMRLTLGAICAINVSRVEWMLGSRRSLAVSTE